MRKQFNRIWLLFAAALLLTGCSMRTVEQMYQLPKRSEDFSNLQTAIDAAMTGLEYCAPLSGENQQIVQMADLNGDADQEYLVFAKGSSELPLKILIFDRVEGAFLHVDTINSNGFAFEQVEYVQMDHHPGVELVVGCQISDQLLRSVSVYHFKDGISEQMVSANYSKFVTADLDQDMMSELFVLRPGQSETDRGIAEVYSIADSVMERSNEVNMSEPVSNLKRIFIGKLHGGETAVFVGSSVEDTALITDIYTIAEGKLTNVSVSNESGTSVKTMRNYYVYSDDIDHDGVLELPQLITMIPLDPEADSKQQGLIRWYAMKVDGAEVTKLFTYHDFVGGWYLELDESIAPRIAVRYEGNACAFYLWDDTYSSHQKLMTIYSLSGQNREILNEEKFVLLKTDTVIYAVTLEEISADYGITQESLLSDFHLIRQAWKTGET